MAKNITKAHIKIFNKAILDFLKDYPNTFTECKSGYSNWQWKDIPTIYGSLTITLYENEESSIYSLYSCFEFVDKIQSLVGANGWSGKFNAHFSGDNLPLVAAKKVINQFHFLKP